MRRMTCEEPCTGLSAVYCKERSTWLTSCYNGNSGGNFVFVPSETMGSPKDVASHMPWARAAQGHLEKISMLDLLGDRRADNMHA